jgi:hypothetical protein
MLKSLSRMRPGKRFTLFVVLLFCTAMMMPVTASAAYYNTYTTVATLNNANNCNNAQGFAVGSTYVYSVKINSDESKAVIYRTKMSDGTTTLMTNGEGHVVEI